MTSLIDFLKHLRTTVKLGIAIIGIVVAATVSGITFFDSKIEASEKKIMELRREDMTVIRQDNFRLEAKLNKMDDDITFMKRCMMQKCWEK